VHLRAKNRSQGTIESYLTCGNALCDRLDAQPYGVNHTDVTSRVLETYLGQMHERVSQATVAEHDRALQRLFRWLVVDGKFEPPEIPEQPAPVLDLGDLAKLLKASAGNAFETRRDTAIIRLSLDTGMRAGELGGPGLEDLDREQSVAFVMGKGGRGPARPYGANTAEALRRYLRERNRNPAAMARTPLWIGKKGP
jgi:site-specific recombinase XerD